MNKRSANALKDAGTGRATSLAASSRAASPPPVPDGKHRAPDKIAALEAEVALYRTALESSRQEMQAFAYSVSHDLRAPLRAIEGFSKILTEDFTAELSPEAERFLKHIVGNTETLGSQIEDLLRFYRAGKNPPTRIPVDADAICREVLAAFLPKDAAKISIPAPLPEVFADPVQLREVFSQLLGNALKFTRHVEAPKIEVLSKTETNTVQIDVRDNGAGFDPKHAQKLFQVFQKLHPVSEYPGNGIGLAIVRRVVQAHGGCVQAAAAPGEGATFSVTLPAQAPGVNNAV